MKSMRKTKGTICCVPGCRSDTAKNRDVSFHKFPNDTEIRKIWIQRVNKKRNNGKYSSWEPTKNHRICGLHFNTTGKKAYEDKYPRFFPYKTYPFEFYENVISEDFSSCYSSLVGNEVIIDDESTSEREGSLIVSPASSELETRGDTSILPPESIKKEENHEYNVIICEHSYSVPLNGCKPPLNQSKKEIILHCDLNEVSELLVQRNKQLEDTLLELERRVEEGNKEIRQKLHEIDILNEKLEASKRRGKYS